LHAEISRDNQLPVNIGCLIGAARCNSYGTWTLHNGSDSVQQQSANTVGSCPPFVFFLFTPRNETNGGIVVFDVLLSFIDIACGVE